MAGLHHAAGNFQCIAGAQQAAIDVVGSNRISVLAKARSFQPTTNVLSRAPTSLLPQRSPFGHEMHSAAGGRAMARALFPPELVVEVQPVTANRQRVADAPAGQAVGRTGPARLPRIALYRGLRRAERVVVAKAGCASRAAMSSTSLERTSIPSAMPRPSRASSLCNRMCSRPASRSPISPILRALRGRRSSLTARSRPRATSTILPPVTSIPSTQSPR